MPKDENLLQRAPVTHIPYTVTMNLTRSEIEAFERYCIVMQLRSGSAAKLALRNLIEDMR